MPLDLWIYLASAVPVASSSPMHRPPVLHSPLCSINGASYEPECIDPGHPGKTSQYPLAMQTRDIKSMTVRKSHLFLIYLHQSLVVAASFQLDFFAGFSTDNLVRIGFLLVRISIARSAVERNIISILRNAVSEI